MRKFFERIGVFGRLLAAVVPMLIFVMIGIGIGGDDNLAFVLRVPVILLSLVVFFLLVRFIQGEDS